MIIEASLVTIAVCMVIILIVIVLIGVNLSRGIKSIDQTIANVEFRVENTLDEVNATLSQATETLDSLNSLSVSIKSKIDTTDPLFHLIGKVGAIASSFISDPRPEFKLSNIINFTREPKDTIKASDIAEWIGLGVLLWEKFKRRV